MKHYPALVRKDADSDYGVEFTDFPGCVSAGATLGEAVANAGQALQLHVDGMRDDGLAIPEPSALDAVITGADTAGAAAVLVPLTGARGRAMRFNATMDEFLLERIDTTAKSLGMSRSALLATAAREYLGSRDATAPDTVSDAAE